MSRTCAICNQGSEVRAQVDKALADNVALRRIASQAGVSDASVRRHRDNCEPLNAVVEAHQQAVEEQIKKDAVPSIDLPFYFDVLERSTRVAVTIAEDTKAEPSVRVSAAKAAGSIAGGVVRTAAEEMHRQEVKRRLDELSAKAEAQLVEMEPEPEAVGFDDILAAE
ncbi:hypothetical protein GS636_06705 [Ruegeria sp. HKCCD4884]|uniref:hypothetical protein n=1 Tax=Ruegeria sp. HKCCD4884 TaxID=2683022 RepID=UPI001492BBE9|nr:hypothetical protein [Ruegeria sp. HKCCD4884]NOD92471.1 hypothetical protein [Ruegeria sp. HKCCD4884]